MYSKSSLYSIPANVSKKNPGNLFAIFLKPGYYVWRAHLLKRKMAFPIVYTVLYALLIMAEIGFVMMQAFSLVMNVM